MLIFRIIKFPYFSKMNKAILFLFACFLSLAGMAQETGKSKIYLKNGDVLTARIVGYKPQESFTIEISVNAVIDIPFKDIDYIVLDANNKNSSKPAGLSAGDINTTPSPKAKKTYGDFYFESVNEGVVGLGVGNIGGLPAIPLIDPFWGGIYGYQNQTIPNATSFGGIYSANGIGYKNWAFAGIGIGAMGYSDDIGFSMPFMLDLRARLMPKKKISPLVMLSTGIAYHKGSVGSLDLNDGAGVSLKLNDQINIHALLAHSYMRYYGRLSASGAVVQDGVYYNYFGVRMGASFRF
jgi:hypothetical protein